MWTTPADCVIGQTAGESLNQYSLNTYVRDNFDWLKNNKFSSPIWGSLPIELDTVYLGGYSQITISGFVESGDSGKISIEVGTHDGARSVIAVVGTDDALSADEQFNIEFFVPANSDYKLTKTGDFQLSFGYDLSAVWNWLVGEDYG